MNGFKQAICEIYVCPKCGRKDVYNKTISQKETIMLKEAPSKAEKST
jgi:hypothetical protein